MNDITAKGHALPDKAEVAEFVSDALEMEVRVHTLRELANETQRKANAIAEKAKKDLTQARAKLERAKKETEAHERRKSRRPEDGYKPYISFRKICKTIAEAFCVVLGIWAAAFFVIVYLFNIESRDLLTAIVVGIGIASVLIVVITPIVMIRKEKREQLGLQKVLCKWDEEIAAKDAQKIAALSTEVTKYERAYCKAQQVSSLMLGQARDYMQRSVKINELLQACYIKTGIIPPDYRYFDCVIVINHVFRNNLGDTVRDAILYYEEKKFRELMLRGINNVYLMLGKLATMVAEATNILSSIQSDVSSLSFDLQNAAEQQITLQKQTLEVSRARKYAEEAYFASQAAHNAYVREHI